MRSVRFSRTFLYQLDNLLAQGAQRFGKAVVLSKRDLVYDMVENHIVSYPGGKRPDRRLRLVVYPITDTPFVVLYDFDDAELRVHFVFHKSASLRGLDPKSAQW